MAEITTYKRDSPKRRFTVAVGAAFSVLAKRASRLPLKLKAAAAGSSSEDWKIELKSTPKPPPAPKKLLSNISSKTLSFIQKKKKKEVWGDGGVWQKTILMGGKCEPLDFSGVIYYDSNGKQVNQMPVRSPRVSPVPAYFLSDSQRNL